MGSDYLKTNFEMHSESLSDSNNITILESSTHPNRIIILIFYNYIQGVGTI